MSTIQFKITLFALGIGTLIIGIAIYVYFRSTPPWLLLWMTDNRTAYFSNLSFIQSIPSGLHAFGFTCLLGACLGGSRLILIMSGLFWLLANIIWELACQPDSPWMELRSKVVAWYLLQPGFSSECTYDVKDILSATVGAITPLFLHLILMSSKQICSSINCKEGKL